MKWWIGVLVLTIICGASAKVHRFHKDAPALEAARKNALKAALKSMNATQKFRTAIWSTYHSRPGGVQALPVPSASASSIT